MFEQVQPQKYYMQIARQIRNLIRDGKLKVGDQLPPERSLAIQFNASRASIREALSALEMLGLIECKGGQGNFIKADGSEGTIDGELLKTLLRDHDPYEIFEARLEMEPNLAALAADRATDQERKKLQSHVQKLKDLGVKLKSDPAFIDEYMEEDRKYHLEIGRCAHNSVLFTVFSGVNLMMKEMHWKVMKSRGLATQENVEAYEKEHEAILDAILAKNPKLAHAEMKKHILILKKTLF